MKHLASVSCCIVMLALAGFAASPAQANDITKEWDSVKPPPVPELKAATVDPKTTALLALDFMKANCGVRPRCAATIPVANKLIEQAHAPGRPERPGDYCGLMEAAFTAARSTSRMSLSVLPPSMSFSWSAVYPRSISAAVIFGRSATESRPSGSE